jgi:hypothetical protein
VNVYIPNVPAGVRGKQLVVDVQPRRVSVGIYTSHPGEQLALGEKQKPHYYLDKELSKVVKGEESFWTFDPEEREIHIQLVKAEEGEVWESVFLGHEGLVETSVEGDKKRLLLERFQRENPGFDFSGAEFTGNVPDPRTFLNSSD